MTSVSHCWTSGSPPLAWSDSSPCSTHCLKSSEERKKRHSFNQVAKNNEKYISKHTQIKKPQSISLLTVSMLNWELEC